MSGGVVSGREVVESVLKDHLRGESSKDCIEGIGWVWACWCDCGWHGRDSDHQAHLADALLATGVVREEAAVRAEALREAAEEVERVERIGLTPAHEIAADEREWFDKHSLRNVDGFQRHRPVIAAWLRDRALAPQDPA